MNDVCARFIKVFSLVLIGSNGKHLRTKRQSCGNYKLFLIQLYRKLHNMAQTSSFRTFPRIFTLTFRTIPFPSNVDFKHCCHYIYSVLYKFILVLFSSVSRSSGQICKCYFSGIRTATLLNFPANVNFFCDTLGTAVSLTEYHP